MAVAGRLKAARENRRSTQLCEIHMGVSEARGLMCNGRLDLCSAIPCGAGSRGGRFVYLCFRNKCGACKFQGGSLCLV